VALVVASKSDGGDNIATNRGGMTVGAAVAWSVLFLALVAMTDIPGTAVIAAGFAWLLLVAILLKFGPDAFGTITSLNQSTTLKGSS
jgi:hypothetical protein